MNDKDSRQLLRKALLVEFLDIEAINIPDLTSDMTDPRNAIYRAPLSEPSDEEDALCMADTNYSVVAGLESKNLNFDHEAAYEQCLTDARRMVADPNYSRLFTVLSDLHAIDEAPKEIILGAAADCFPRLTAEQRENLFQDN